MGLYSGIAERLRNGEPQIVFRPHGRSMEPIIHDGEKITVRRLDPDEPVDIGDVVLARVKGRVYLHLISAMDGRRIQISNNHGHVNGWTTRDKLYGKVG